MRVLKIEQQIQSGLRRIVEDLEVDQASIWELLNKLGEIRPTHAWSRVGVPSLPTVIRASETPEMFAWLRQGDSGRFAQAGAGPEVLRDGQTLARFGTRSTVEVPLIIGGSVAGAMVVGTVNEERRWPDQLIPRLRLLADVFANSLARQRAERAADESAERIRDLAGRLMSAQEEERRRIARELHDDVNQELAALSIALSTLGRRLPEAATDLCEEVTRLQERTVGLSEGVRQLSHGLHPGVLQHVGLVAALRGYCLEFEGEHGLGVEFKANGDMHSISSDAALCLYRVTQEALRNIVKHAHARHVRVTLTRVGTEVGLTIGDDGGGFDLAEARSCAYGSRVR